LLVREGWCGRACLRRAPRRRVTSDAMGHLDEVALERAVLLLPAE
jgi:hypothetical protein